MAEGGMAEGGMAEGGMAEGGMAEGGMAEGGMAEGGMAVGGPKSVSKKKICRTCLQLMLPEMMCTLLTITGVMTVVFRLVLQYLGPKEIKHSLTGAVFVSLCLTMLCCVGFLVGFIYRCHRLGETINKAIYQKQPAKTLPGKRAPVETTAV
eukprot:GHVQ01017328.1.p1 GENE.GHVQ01017328.1~~GHVQ01017328.1.p1  ORF type:complete len:151 (+),score=15.14 GHVQ01017328.1:2-454(+)